MSFDCEIDDSPRIRITAHARERMRAEDRNVPEGEVIEVVRKGKRSLIRHGDESSFPPSDLRPVRKGKVYRITLGRVTAIVASEETEETVLTVYSANR